MFSFSLLLPSTSFAYDINRQSLYDYGPYYGDEKKILGLTASAQEPNPLPIPSDAVIPTASFPLPGNPFYFVKGAFETLQTTFTFNPITDEEIRLRHATERLAEVNALVADGNYTLANETALRYQSTIEQINENITNLAGAGTDVSQFAASLEQTTIKQAVVLEATLVTAPPIAADSLRTALDAAQAGSDTAADVLNKEAVTGELKDALAGLKDQGILKQEIYDKLVATDTRSEVRDELEKLNEAGIVPNLELKALDSGQKDLYPEYYSRRLENLKFAELKALEAVSPPTDPDEQERLEEFIRTYKSGEVIPGEMRQYIPFLRLAQLARTVKLDTLTPTQEEEVFRYYHSYLSENPTYKAEDFTDITPVGIVTPVPESTPSAQTPVPVDQSLATPSAAPYIGSPGFILPDSPFYFAKRFGETFGQITNFGTKSSLEYRLRLAETRLAEANALFAKGKDELALSAIKNYTNEIGYVTERLKELETSGVVVQIGDALDIAPRLEFNVTRANIVFERNLLPLPPTGADIFKEAIKSTQTAADVVADTLDRPPIPAVLIERIDNLKNLGFITPQEAERLLQVDSRQELRGEVEKLIEAGTFPIADAKKLDDRQSQLYPDEFNKLVEVRKIEELQRLRAIQAEIAQTPALRANAENYGKRIDELQQEVNLGLISADPIGQRLTQEYTKIATASANLEATPSAVPVTPLPIPQPFFAKPGDPWYFLKGGFEFVQTQIALTPTAKANVVLGIARERLAEAIALDSQGKKDKAAESYKEYVVELENLIKNVKGYNLSPEQGKV
ncbi:hypothetical protein HYW39_00060, partial [Candidatus Curtissbacteria bacterium]|nr:hypothetical protein [Candidatus Curtissbacteria bacterium]